MNKIKKILYILFLSSIIFGCYKTYGYMSNFNEIENKINKEISINENKINQLKPVIKEISIKEDDVLKDLRLINGELIKFDTILSNTIIVLEKMDTQIEIFDKSIKQIEPIIENINKVLLLSTKGLKKATPFLQKIENNTKSINNKIEYINKLKIKRQELLQKVMQYNATDMNKLFLEPVKIPKELLGDYVLDEDKISKEAEELKTLQKLIENTTKKNTNITPEKVIDEIPEIPKVNNTNRIW